MALGHAHQLSMEEAKSNNDINCLPHHGVLNINKPGQVFVVFGASVKFHNTSLKDDLLPVVDILNNLIYVLLRHREGSFAVVADIKKMFHKVRMCLKDTDALRFLWRAKDDINDYIKLLHIKSRFPLLHKLSISKN